MVQRCDEGYIINSNIEEYLSYRLHHITPICDKALEGIDINLLNKFKDDFINGRIIYDIDNSYKRFLCFFNAYLSLDVKHQIMSRLLSRLLYHSISANLLRSSYHARGRISAPRSTNELRHYLNICEQIQHDQIRRNENKEHIDIIDFLLIYCLYIDTDSSTLLDLVKYYFETSSNMMLFLPPSNREMNNTFTHTNNLIERLDPAKIFVCCRSELVKQFIDAYNRDKTEVDYIKVLWHCYKAVQKVYRREIYDVLLISQFEERYIDPLKEIKDFLNGKRFLDMIR